MKVVFFNGRILIKSKTPIKSMLDHSLRNLVLNDVYFTISLNTFLYNRVAQFDCVL